MEVEKKMIDQETMNWINKLTTTDREFIIKTLTEWRKNYDPSIEDNKEIYVGFCEGFLIPKKFLEPIRNEEMIQEIFNEYRKKLPKELLTF